MKRLFAIILLLTGPALAQPAPHDFWGGPDSPGGLFGGDPRDADEDLDRQVHPDEFWRWLRGRAEGRDRNGDAALSARELGLRQDAPAMRSFKAGDADSDGRLTMPEVQAMGMRWFQARDRNGDQHLQPAELPRQGRRPARPPSSSPVSRPAPPPAPPLGPPLAQ